MEFHEEAFEAAAEITAAVAEEAEIELNAEGAEKAAEFFSVLYKKLSAVARGEDEKPERSGHFEMYQDAKGKYRFRLKACNGQTVAVSQPYKEKASCLKGIESVKHCSCCAETKEM